MRKGIVALTAILCLVVGSLLGLGCAPTDTSNDIKNFSAVYQSDQTVSFRWDCARADSFNIYAADTLDDAFSLQTTTQDKTFVGDAHTFYKIATVKNGSEVATSEPFSYVYSYFGGNARVFTPDDQQDDIQAFVDEYYSVSAWDQEGTDRLAMLFMPGVYDEVDMHIGYFTSVNGLGYFPSDVTMKALHTFDHPTNKNADHGVNTSLSNFWRAIENVTLNNDSLWSVCQATSFRRMHAKGHLELAGRSWSSGGYIADSRVDGTVYAKSQQQWFTRNSHLNNWNGTNINYVFAGVTGTLPSDWTTSNRVTKLATTAVTREKPFVVFDEEKGYGVFLPDFRYDASGYSWENNSLEGEFIGIDQFYVAKSDRDNADSINAALNRGKHLILSPGIYKLDKPIEVNNANTIVLGLGLATLEPTSANRNMLLKLADQPGINVSSILFNSGEYTDYMMVIGENGASSNHANNPICVADIFSRSGAFKIPYSEVDTTVLINSSDVLGDHFWLWRADHGFEDGDRTMRLDWDDWTLNSSTWTWKYSGNTLFIAETGRWPVKEVGGWYNNRGRVGLEVNGDRVSIYGLFVEHYQEYQTIWNGEDGFVCFYQCETPYEMEVQEEWMRDGGTAVEDQGWAGYKISDFVQNHEAWGIGVYMVKFPIENPVVMYTAIEAPSNPGIKLYHMITAKLGTSHPDDEILHIINDRGGSTLSTSRPAFTSFVGGVYTP